MKPSPFGMKSAFRSWFDLFQVVRYREVLPDLIRIAGVDVVHPDACASQPLIAWEPSVDPEGKLTECLIGVARSGRMTPDADCAAWFAIENPETFANYPHAATLGRHQIEYVGVPEDKTLVYFDLPGGGHAAGGPRGYVRVWRVKRGGLQSPLEHALLVDMPAGMRGIYDIRESADTLVLDLCTDALSLVDASMPSWLRLGGQMVRAIAAHSQRPIYELFLRHVLHPGGFRVLRSHVLCALLKIGSVVPRASASGNPFPPTWFG